MSTPYKKFWRPKSSVKVPTVSELLQPIVAQHLTKSSVKKFQSAPLKGEKAQNFYCALSSPSGLLGREDSDPEHIGDLLSETSIDISWALAQDYKRVGEVVMWIIDKRFEGEAKDFLLHRLGMFQHRAEVKHLAENLTKPVGERVPFKPAMTPAQEEARRQEQLQKLHAYNQKVATA